MSEQFLDTDHAGVFLFVDYPKPIEVRVTGLVLRWTPLQSVQVAIALMQAASKMNPEIVPFVGDYVHKIQALENAVKLGQEVAQQYLERASQAEAKANELRKKLNREVESYLTKTKSEIKDEVVERLQAQIKELEADKIRLGNLLNQARERISDVHELVSGDDCQSY